jgi:hypothetical protein
LDSAKFEFSKKKVEVEVYPSEEDEIYALSINIDYWQLDWQVSSIAQFTRPSVLCGGESHSWTRHA